MKNNFLTHRLFPIFSVFVLCAFVLCSNVFASSNIDFTYNNVDYSLPSVPDDGNSYFLVVIFDVANLRLFTSSKPITYLDSTKYSGYGEVYGENANLYEFAEGSSSWTLDTVYGSNMWRSNANNSTYFVYSNHDILNKNTSSLVFQGAPQVTPEEPAEVVQVELAPLMTSIDFSKVMGEVLGILPTLLVVLIGLLALRKAIRLLLQMLQKA